MLPDFPKIKDELHTLFMTQLSLTSHEEAPLTGVISHPRYFEGRGSTSVREDGSVERVELEEYSATETYDLDEIKGFTLEEAFNRYKETLVEVRKKQERTIISRTSEAAKSVGNEIDAKGEELSPEHIIEMLEKVRVDFDEQGEPIMPTLVVHPKARKKIEDVYRQLEEEPYRSRMEEVMQKKRREWNDRESSRKLVD